MPEVKDLPIRHLQARDVLLLSSLDLMELLGLTEFQAMELTLAVSAHITPPFQTVSHAAESLEPEVGILPGISTKPCMRCLNAGFQVCKASLYDCAAAQCLSRLRWKHVPSLWRGTGWGLVLQHRIKIVLFWVVGP